MKLYVIEADHGKCKIGISEDPMSRLKQLESAGGFVAKNFFYVEIESQEAETKLLLKFARNRQMTSFKSKSEWVDARFEFIVAEALLLNHTITIQGNHFEVEMWPTTYLTKEGRFTSLMCGNEDEKHSFGKAVLYHHNAYQTVQACIDMFEQWVDISNGIVSSLLSSGKCLGFEEIEESLMSVLAQTDRISGRASEIRNSVVSSLQHINRMRLSRPITPHHDQSHPLQHHQE